MNNTNKTFPKKVYTTKNGVVSYSYSTTYKKWVFTSNNGITFLSQAPGGSETAHKIANILSGSITRKKVIDNLARTNINRIVSPRSKKDFVNI